MKFLEPMFGIVRAFYDVVVQRNGDAEWIAIGRQPAVAGELLYLDVEEQGQLNELAVCVVESRPVLLDGDVRYRIRLQTGDTVPIPYEQQVRRG